MKDAIDSFPADRTVEAEGFANRKLIRPSLNRTDHNHAQASPMGEHRDRERSERPERNERNDRPSGGGRKPAPPEQTNAENFYYVKQMQARTPMALVLDNGEVLKGTVEWYDRDCIKLTRQGSPNLLIFKRVIKYVYKDGEESANGGDE